MLKKKSLIITIVSVVVALAIAAGSFFIFYDFDDDDSKKKPANKKPTTSQNDDSKEPSDGIIWDEDTMQDPVGDNLEDMLEDMGDSDMEDNFEDEFDIPIMGVPDIEDENDYGDSEPDGKDILTPIFEDDFEGYSELSSGDAVPGYNTYHGGQEISCTLDDQFPRSGKYSLKVNYTSTSVGWTGLSIPLDAENWYHHDYMSFFIRGDGAPQVMVIGVDSYRKRMTISSDEWQYVKITWEDLGLADDKALLVGVKEIVIALGSETDRNFWIDDIKILKDTDSDPGKTVLLNEEYEGGFNKDAYVADPDDNTISISKDSETYVDGKNSGKITYSVDGMGYATLNMNLGLQMWADLNVMSFDIKGDGTNQKAIFGFKCGEESFEKEYYFNSTEWKKVRLKLAEFSGTGKKNLTAVTGFYIKVVADNSDTHTIWLDNLKVEYYETPSVKTDKFFTMEEGTKDLPDTWKVSAAYNKNLTAELSTNDPYEGKYAAKLNIPEDNGSNFCAFNIEFEEPFDVSEAGKKFTVYMKGDTYRSTQQIRFIITTVDGGITTGLTNVTSNGKWQGVVLDGGVDYALSDAAVKRVTGIELLFATYDAPRTVYIDSIEAAKSEWVEVIDPSLVDENTLEPPAWGADWGVNEITFDTPKDLSGSDGTIVFIQNTNSSSSIITRFRIFTKNATSELWATDSFYTDITGEQRFVINLSDLGLTDEDLKEVTGYRIECAANSSPIVLYYTILAPRPFVEEEIVTESEILSADAGKNGQSYGVINYDFIPQLNMSNSEGTLVLRYWSDVTASFHTPTTAIYINGKTIKLPEWFSATTEKKEYLINLADYGITNDDLKKVEAVVIHVSSQGEQSNFYVQLAVPKVEEVTPESEVLSADAGKYGQSYGVINYDFIPQLNMSGSNGTLILRYWADVEASFHTPITAIYINGKTIKLPDWFSATTEKQDYVIKLADYGMTDDDLKKVEAVVIHASSQGEQSNFYVQLATPLIETNAIHYAETAPVIDGTIDEVWDTTNTYYTDFNKDENYAHGYFKALWREDTLYVLGVVYDSTLIGISPDSLTNNIAFWMSETASDKSSYDSIPGDRVLAINQSGKAAYYYGDTTNPNYKYAAKISPLIGVNGGYIVEAALPVQTENFQYAEGNEIKIGISIDDDTDGDNVRDHYCASVDPEKAYWEAPKLIPTLKLVK